MQQLSDAGLRAVTDLAQRYGVSTDAVATLLSAVAAGGGTMAQFYHSELGGGGQWMQGGMTMVGDMFNGGLQARVSGLCSELSTLLGSSTQVFQAPSPSPGSGFMGGGQSWWPSELGSPSSSGGQNDSRYAYFPRSRRLAVESAGQVTIFDTLDHAIGGVQQQQGGSFGSFSFSSQFGTFTVDSLPRVSASGGPASSLPPPNSSPPPMQSSPPAQPDNLVFAQPPSDVIAAIERLGQLHQQGVLTDDEFFRKKAELLSRL